MNIVITFDYELFLGPYTGTVDNCLITPTNKYLSLADKYGIKYVFFVDVLYLLKSQEYINQYPDLKSDYDKVLRQLKNVSEKGHDVELHLHPQWYYSTFDGGGWKLDFKHYKLSDCPLIDVKEMITKGCNFIYETTGVWPKAYRAGGYSFPNDIIILDEFIKNGIKYDSSVLMLTQSSGKFQTYDYSLVSDFDPYCFTNNNSIETKNGQFIEYPVSCAFFPHWYYSLKLRFSMHRNKHLLKVFGDGKGIGYLKTKEVSNKKSYIKLLLDKSYVRASLDFSNSCFLFDMYKRVKKSDGNLMLIIGHPKNATLYSYKMLDAFVNKVNKNTKNKIITFRAI